MLIFAVCWRIFRGYCHQRPLVSPCSPFQRQLRSSHHCFETNSLVFSACDFVFSWINTFDQNSRHLSNMSTSKLGFALQTPGKKQMKTIPTNNGFSNGKQTRITLMLRTTLPFFSKLNISKSVVSHVDTKAKVQICASGLIHSGSFQSAGRLLMFLRGSKNSWVLTWVYADQLTFSFLGIQSSCALWCSHWHLWNFPHH